MIYHPRFLACDGDLSAIRISCTLAKLLNSWSDYGRLILWQNSCDRMLNLTAAINKLLPEDTCHMDIRHHQGIDQWRPPRVLLVVRSSGLGRRLMRSGPYLCSGDDVWFPVIWWCIAEPKYVFVASSITLFLLWSSCNNAAHCLKFKLGNCRTIIPTQHFHTMGLVLICFKGIVKIS